MTGFNKIVPGVIFKESLERHRLNQIKYYKQMVANRQQVMVKIAELTADLLDMALEDGSVVRNTLAFRKVQVQLGTLSEMEETMTLRIDEFIIEHGYFWED